MSALGGYTSAILGDLLGPTGCAGAPGVGVLRWSGFPRGGGGADTRAWVLMRGAAGAASAAE